MDFQLSSSIRKCDVYETLEKAKKYAKSFGITRVTDTTWLDRIGIPVYASIRPGAKKGSLCVNAGKGIRHVEAKVGAYMEAIEFSVAENWDNNYVERATKTLEEVMADNDNHFDFIDLCPIFCSVIDTSKKISVVKSYDIITGNNYWVPSELVFLVPPISSICQSIYGSSSNGLASGNTIKEAIVHGISEVMERDVQSFMNINDTSRMVDLDNSSEVITNLVNKIKSASLDVTLRYSKNKLNQAYFQAYIMEKHSEAPVSIAIGTGCHPVKEIAAVRAITEAAQSRLSHIHGGRDDIIDRVKYFDDVGKSIEIKSIENLKKVATSSEDKILYNDIFSFPTEDISINGLNDYLLGVLKDAGMNHVLVVTLSDPNDALQVVKVIVPKLESFDVLLKRVGRRLGVYARDEL